MKLHIKLAINIGMVWVAIAIELTDNLILGIKISFERSILIVVLIVAELFLQELVKRGYGKHPASTDDGRTWYPYACKFAKIKCIIFIHSMGEASYSKQLNTLKIEQNVLIIIIFHVQEITVTVN
jgi:hypothetical protein